MRKISWCILIFLVIITTAHAAIGEPISQDSIEAKEAFSLIKDIDKQSLIIVNEYNRIHLKTDDIYVSIWNDEFAVSQYLELATYIIDTTNSIPADSQDWNTKFRLWRSLFILSKRCQSNEMNLSQSLNNIIQSGIRSAVSKQLEIVKAGCNVIDSELAKYKHDFPEHSINAGSYGR